MDIQYGSFDRITTLDDDGSTMTESVTMHNGEKKDVKIRFKMRVRVHSEKELLTEFLRFRSETKDMVNASFSIDHTAAGNKEGFFYAVKSWTEVK